jgi:hypothetical protein
MEKNALLLQGFRRIFRSDFDGREGIPKAARHCSAYD